MRHKDGLFAVFTILAVFIIQITFSYTISIYGAFPNLVLLGTICFGLTRGSAAGELAGFFWGLLADVASISIFGSQTFMLTLIGYIAGRFQGQINEEKPVAQMSLVFAMSLIYLLGLMAFESLFGGSTQRFKGEISFLQPVYSTVACPLFFYFWFQWSSLFHRPDLTTRLP